MADQDWPSWYGCGYRLRWCLVLGVGVVCGLLTAHPETHPDPKTPTRPTHEHDPVVVAVSASVSLASGAGCGCCVLDAPFTHLDLPTETDP